MKRHTNTDKISDIKARIAEKREELARKRVRETLLKTCDEVKQWIDIPRPEGWAYDIKTQGKIPVTIGCGIRYEDNGKVWISAADLRHGKRLVNLDVHSWIGTSPGAIHYYGKLTYDSAGFRCIDAPDSGTCYPSDKHLPQQYLSGTIRLTRVITDAELKDKHRYEGYSKGDRIEGFYSTKEVVECAKEVFKEVFDKGWELVIGDIEE